MVLCLLGSIAVLLDGRLVPLRLRPKALALLARLALVQGRFHRRELAELLFNEAENPRGALRWHLLYLRRELPPALASCLEIGRDQIGFEFPTDVGSFRQPSEVDFEKPEFMETLLGLYRGDLCAGLTVTASLSFDTWLFTEQDELRRRFRRMVLVFARSAKAAQYAEKAIGPLQKLLSVDPYCEDAHVALIEAYEAIVQPEAAEATFRRYERVLREDLGAEPRTSIAQRYSSPHRTGRQLPREGPVPLPKVTLHVVEWPGGVPAILAIHGSGGSGHSLAALGERLSPEFEFIAPDLRGHGFSDKPPSGYEISQHVEDITELAARMSLNSPVLLGFSLGGAIAAAIATQMKPRGLILLDGVIGKRAFMQNAAAQLLPRMGPQLESRFGGFSEYLAQWQRPSIPYSDEAERLLRRFVHFELAPLSDGAYRRRTVRSALEESWLSAGQTETLGLLAQVRCPVLIVHAKQPWLDGHVYLSNEAIQDQLAACPQAELVEAPKSDHAVLIRDPEPVVIEAIQAFIGRED